MAHRQYADSAKNKIQPNLEICWVVDDGNRSGLGKDKSKPTAFGCSVHWIWGSPDHRRNKTQKDRSKALEAINHNLIKKSETCVKQLKESLADYRRYVDIYHSSKGMA